MANTFLRGPGQQDAGSWENFKKKISKDIFSYTPSARFISGGRVVIKLNGIPAPRLSNIAWRITTDQKVIREIDSYVPAELAPNFIDISGSYTEYREPFRGPTSSSLQASVLSFMWHPYITIEVRDNLTEALLLFVGKAAISERSESVSIDGLMMTSIRWQGIAWKDEMEPVIPADNAGTEEQGTQNIVSGLIDSIIPGKNVTGVAGGFLKKLF